VNRDLSAAILLIGLAAASCTESPGGRPPAVADASAGNDLLAVDVLPPAGDVLPPVQDAGDDVVPDLAADTAREAGRADGAIDRTETSGGACPPSSAPLGPDQPWIVPFASDVIGRLSGELELIPGLSLRDRATTSSRKLARDHLAAVLQQFGLTPQTHEYGTGVNLFARLNSTTGAGPEVVLGAHFDTVPQSPGANDNATGVAVVLAVARFLSQLDCRSKAVVVVLFDEEEVGRLGSQAFAAKLAADGVAVHSVHTVDQVGWDRNADRLIELQRADPGLRELYDRAVVKLGVAIPLVDTSTGSTDHVSFRPRFPAVGVTEGYRSGDTTPHRHMATDRFPTINIDYLKSTTVLVSQVIADLVR